MDLLKFALTLGKLKGLKRSGWLEHNITNPESVAEHSFRLACLCMLIAPQLKVNQLRCIKMALIHDIGETEIGDIVTRKGGKLLPNLQNKKNLERKALKKILSQVDGEEYLKLFDEFEENKTKEAKLVKQLDKLEMGIQALEYEQTLKLDLGEFFDDTKSVLVSKYLKEILKKVEKLRKKGI